MNKKFIHEYQFKNFTDALNKHYLDLGCEIEFKDESVIIWYIEKLEKVA